MKRCLFTWRCNYIFIVLLALGCDSGDSDPNQLPNTPPTIAPASLFNSLTGAAMFYFATDPLCSSVSVTLSSKTFSITKFFPVTPECGAAGSATFPMLSPGDYEYTATSTCEGRNWDGKITIAAGACTKKVLDTFPKAVTLFWIKETTGCDKISVVIGQKTAFITSQRLTPSCTGAGSAYFELTPGTHQYTATCPGYTWSGTITVKEQGCNIFELTNPVSNAGRVVFWAKTEELGGSIQVKVGTSAGKIENFFPTGPPLCGAQNSLTFTLADGVYTFEAASLNRKWKKEITITKGQCTQVELSDDNVIQGKALIWSQPAISCGEITISFFNKDRTISPYVKMKGYSISAPTCDNPGNAALLALPVGTYNYIASCAEKNWQGSVVIAENLCTIKELQQGQAMFWTQTSANCGTITVTVDNIASRTITTNFPSGAPACGASGAATFNLPTGIHTYVATCNGKSWSGSINVVTGQCSKMQISPGTGIETGTGKALFWVKTDLKCGPITVSLLNGVGAITKFMTSTPACGADGAVTFEAPAGTHNFTASCTGRTWAGTVTVTNNGCTNKELTVAADTPDPAPGGPCGSMNQFIVPTATFKNICGGRDLDVKIKNNSTEKVTVHIAMERDDGSWACEITHIPAGKTGSFWECGATGQISLKSMLSSDFFDKNCFFGANACPK